MDWWNLERKIMYKTWKSKILEENEELEYDLIYHL